MINKHILTKEQALDAIKNGEFSSDVIHSSDRVVVVMTQDWCPQWGSMSRWIYGLSTSEDMDIYDLIYNKVDYFQEFRSFKETKWGNYTIPYLRYYREGKLFKETNYVGKEEFQRLLGL